MGNRPIGTCQNSRWEVVADFRNDARIGSGVMDAHDGLNAAGDEITTDC